jgi:hypothetical protein
VFNQLQHCDETERYAQHKREAASSSFIWVDGRDRQWTRHDIWFEPTLLIGRDVDEL